MMMTETNTNIKLKAVIVGTGDMAHGLANMHHCFGNKEHYEVIVTEPLPDVELGGMVSQYRDSH